MNACEANKLAQNHSPENELYERFMSVIIPACKENKYQTTITLNNREIEIFDTITRTHLAVEGYKFGHISKVYNHSTIEIEISWIEIEESYSVFLP